jgi:hypothetical protein
VPQHRPAAACRAALGALRAQCGGMPQSEHDTALSSTKQAESSCQRTLLLPQTARLRPPWVTHEVDRFLETR